MRHDEVDWPQVLGPRSESTIALRRDFHRHPELSGHEYRTAAIIAERLHAAKLDEQHVLHGASSPVDVAATARGRSGHSSSTTPIGRRNRHRKARSR